MNGADAGFKGTSQSCKVYAAQDFTVILGANMGDAAAADETACPGDIYMLGHDAEEARLIHGGVAHLTDGGSDARQVVTTGSAVGSPGDPVNVMGRLTLMAENGSLLEVIVLNCGGQRYIRALGPLLHRREYTLIETQCDIHDAELADIACVSFTRGTRITMANGLQSRVEELQRGDRVLTRDHGAQEIRWIGRQTVRAHGAFAPIVITQGAMNNSGDLILSPDHRLFIYQRRDELGVGRAEVLIKAKYLVNDDTIYQREGGFVEYFHILFDKHEIIFAEGIQAESLLVSGHTMAALPQDMASEVAARFPRRAKQQRMGAEADRSLMKGRDPAEVLRRASTGCERPSGPSFRSRRRTRKNAGALGYIGSNHDSGML